MSEAVDSGGGHVHGVRVLLRGDAKQGREASSRQHHRDRKHGIIHAPFSTLSYLSISMTGSRSWLVVAPGGSCRHRTKRCRKATHASGSGFTR